MTDRPLTATEAELCETIQDLNHRVTALRNEGAGWQNRAEELTAEVEELRAALHRWRVWADSKPTRDRPPQDDT